MSKVAFKDFVRRFKKLQDLLEPTTPFSKSLYRDLLHRRNVYIVAYRLDSYEECLELLDKALDSYHKDLSVDLLGHCINQRPDSREHDLFLIYNQCTSLDELIYDGKSDRLRLMSIREIIYVFLRVSKMLSFLESSKSHHGNVDEFNLFVDQDFKLKMMLIPGQDSNVVRLYKFGQFIDKKYCPSLLSPEQMKVLEKKNSEALEPNYHRGVKADLFSLGLMCIRLLSPKAFNQGYSLERLEVDFNRLYILIDTLGTFVDSPFAQTIKQCLCYDQSFRPEAQYLVEEIISTHPDLPDSLLKVSKRDFEQDTQFTPSQESMDFGAETPPASHRTNGLFSAPQSTHNLLFSRKPMTRAVHTLHAKPVPDSGLFSSETGDFKLDRLRSDCLNFIENKVFDNLPHRQKRQFTSEHKYSFKILRDAVQIGFVLKSNQDIYFGYLDQALPNDIGILFLANREVYFGEFRAGKISGRGCLLMENGMMMDGDWLDNQLHGNCVVWDTNPDSTNRCLFHHGELVTKEAVEPSSLSGDYQQYCTLEDFYYREFKKCLPIDEIYHDFLLPNASDDQGGQKLPAKYSRKPVGRTHRFKRRYDDFMATNPQALPNEDLHDSRDSEEAVLQFDYNKAEDQEEIYEDTPDRQRKAAQAGSGSKPGALPTHKLHGGSSLDYQLPPYINSNTKEKQFEQQGREKLNTKTHKQIENMLENPNRNFTVDRIFSGLDTVQPRQSEEIFAHMNREDPKHTNSSIMERNYSSPPKFSSNRKPVPVYEESKQAEHLERSGESQLAPRYELEDEEESENNPANTFIDLNKFHGKFSADTRQQAPDQSEIADFNQIELNTPPKNDMKKSYTDSRLLVPVYPTIGSSSGILPSHNSNADSRIEPKKNDVAEHDSSSKSPEPKKHPKSVGYRRLDLVEEKQVLRKPEEDHMGYGWIRFRTGEKFYGFFVDGLPNGLGTFYTFDDVQVSGKWKRGVFV